MSANSGFGRAIAVVVSIAISRPWVTVIAILGLATAGLIYAGQNLKINTDTADMISESLPWRQDFINYRDSFPARDRNIVAVVDGENSETSMSFARDLAAALEAEPSLFPLVFLQGSGEFFDNNGLLYLPLDELQQLADRLFAAQPLLGSLSSDVSGAGLLGVLRESIEQREELTPSAVDELDLIFDELASTLGASAEGRRRPIAWGGLIGSGAGTSERQLLLIQPTLDFNRARPARDAIERLREIGDQLEQRYGDRVELRLTGTLAMEHEELTSVIRSASTAGVAALIMVIVVLFFSLGSPALLMVAVAVLLSGLSLTAAFAAVTVVELNLLSVAFAVLYIGLGVDFILHMSLRLKELCAKGRSLDEALIETAGGVGGSLLICAITTAAGFLAFIPTDFVGVSELGLISAGGMIISLIVSLSLLPALIKLVWRRGASRIQSKPPPKAHRPRRPLPAVSIVAVAAVVCVIALALLPGLTFNGNPVHLRDPEAESIMALDDLANDSEAPLFSLAVLVDDSSERPQLVEALADLPSVERVITVASLVPGDMDDKLFEIADLEFSLSSTLTNFQPQPADPGRMATALAELTGLMGGLDAPSVSQGAFETSANAWFAHWAELSAGEAGQLARDLEADLLGNLVEQVSRLSAGLNAEAFDRNDLPADLLDRWVNAAGQELIEVVPREDLNDNEAAARFVAEVRSVAPNATGLPVVYQEAAATVTRAFTLALLYAFAIVSLLLIYFLRSFRDTLLVLVPITFAAVVTAATSVLLDVPLNFANIIALPLLIGVGVDSGIHMVHRMRTEPSPDDNPLHTSTSRAVFLSALTTVASFGNLAFSTHPGMASMGQLLTIGMLVSLVAVLGLLPALMRLGRPA